MIKYIADSVEWRDKTYGNTCSSTRKISTETGEIVKVFPFSYGNGHNNALTFKKAENMNFDNIYMKRHSQGRASKQAEQWGKL